MPENWKKVDELFHAALERKGSEREKFLRIECGDDEKLFEEIFSLIASFEDDENFMRQSAFAVGAKLIVKENENLFGQRIGAHKIISELGRGGMGAVYLAVRDDDEYQQRVALKIIRENVSSPSSLERFRRERQILANLNHSNISRLLDGGTTKDGTPYFVMEYVRGENVVTYAARKNLSINERLKIFLKICDAVTHAHKQEVIHRDIKPSNVLVTNEGEPKLLDFGIAKVLRDYEREEARTMTGFHLFTPEYSSPEQARGESLSKSSDIYSLGVLLYELLTEKHPYKFLNRTPFEIARIICESEPERPSTAVFRHRETSEENNFHLDENKLYETSRLLRGDLDNIILMAIRKESVRRYRNVEELSADIENYLKNLPVKARPNSTFYRSTKFVKRNKAATVLCSLLVACVVFFAVYGLLPRKTKIIYPNSPPQPNDAAIKISNISVTDDFLKFSADGNTMFLVSNKQIYSINTDGKNLAQVKSQSLRIAQSPDGNFFAYSEKDGIFIADNNFNHPKKVTDCSAGRFAWSPDSEQIVYACVKENQTNIFTVKTDGRDERQITNTNFSSDPNWSPDGKRIVFSSERDGNLDVYMIDADGRNELRLTGEKQADRLPVFSPDGKHIAFSSDRSGHEEIYLMNADGDNAWKLTNSNGYAQEPAWSPDGKSIAFISNRDGNYAVYLLNVETQMAAEEKSSDIDASFSTDEKRIAVSSNRHGSFQIYTSDTNGKNIRQLTSGKSDSGFPRFSPDGKQILFDSNRDGIDAVYLMNADGTNQVRLTNIDSPCRRPSWSSDKRKIAFVKLIDESNEIFTLDLESGEEMRLTFNAKNDDFPVWTGDGRIVFFSDRIARNEIYIMNADGSDITNLTNNPANDGEPAVSKNGKIVFTSTRTGTTELWMMDIDGKNLIQLTNTAPDGFNSRPQFSHDGRRIIYDSNENDREVMRFLNIP